MVLKEHLRDSWEIDTSKQMNLGKVETLLANIIMMGT